MKKIIINYYGLIIVNLFIIYNIILKNLKIEGLLYKLFMINIIIINITILIKFKKNIKLKSLIIIIYFLTWFLFSKNALQLIFGISNIITLIIIGFSENNFIKILSVIIGLFLVTFSIPLFFIFILTYDTGINDIYNDTHYFCENNYEIYSYSAGAMDKFHYSIGKHYELINIDDIIYISYNERNEVSEKDYKNYLNNHKCKLVGDINESK